jgi:hypothetical protein
MLVCISRLSRGDIGLHPVQQSPGMESENRHMQLKPLEKSSHPQPARAIESCRLAVIFIRFIDEGGTDVHPGRAPRGRGRLHQFSFPLPRGN